MCEVCQAPPCRRRGRCVVDDIVKALLLVALFNDLSAEVVEQGPLYEMDENGVVWGAEIGEATQSSHDENKRLTLIYFDSPRVSVAVFFSPDHLRFLKDVIVLSFDSQTDSSIRF